MTTEKEVYPNYFSILELKYKVKKNILTEFKGTVRLTNAPPHIMLSNRQRKVRFQLIFVLFSISTKLSVSLCDTKVRLRIPYSKITIRTL
jgi:hypothetical protein